MKTWVKKVTFSLTNLSPFWGDIAFFMKEEGEQTHIRTGYGLLQWQI